MSASLTAPRGTCQHCGRYVVTVARKGETTLRARSHSYFNGAVGTEREWIECPGSKQQIKAGS